ncbi:MutS-related protein [Flagellimonas aequoris]|uniref:DNA mismatch repair protein MutS n=1 Tax=Flagellimonas aequoris TaxID=2306997 RepID=A0A418NBS3_9FLAO|nr:DNA mismatch repair protein MutS [Allomuricauda aequoris]RIV73689.1 DNA mismatch repair protein MutS [Allomuricauda aequoris]TXK07373.1 DNA mismatch repair protein MutS [Allomuricauda aequoris]
MDGITTFYTQQRDKHNEELKRLKKQLALLASLRLLVFVATGLAMYFLWTTSWVYWIFPLGLAGFLYLVSRYSDLKWQKGYVERLISINNTELEVAARRFHHLSDGKEFLVPEHPYAQDLDLFGRGSFYQYANRTALKQGSQVFAGLLLDGYPKDIAKKQEAVQELAQMPEWRQRFSALAGGTHPEVPHHVVSKWLKEHVVFVPQWIKYVAPAFALGSIGLIIAAVSGWIPEALVLYWYFIGIGIVGRYGKNILRFSSDVSKAQETIEQYQKLISELEEKEFASELLRDLQQKLILDGEKTSKILKKFTRHMAMLDQQNNLLILMFGQGLALWSLYFAYQVEDWIGKYGKQVESWFQAIAYFDAYNSLGNYAFNHPDHTYPHITEGPMTLLAKAVGHPLVDPQKNVLNDFSLDEGRFSIVTGANMAGKSTFLRAVALQIVMANMGLPVKGKEVQYKPVRLLTSMRSSDSLADETSYFYAELKRLKYIVEELEKGNCFVVLDEILKGTNSVDKAEGSKKFVEKLVRSGATGLVATHDLSLCTLADKLPQVENHYFDAQIVNGELYFDYRFKEGICQNMNASFLLKKMGIVD